MSVAFPLGFCLFACSQGQALTLALELAMAALPVGHRGAVLAATRFLLSLLSLQGYESAIALLMAQQLRALLARLLGAVCGGIVSSALPTLSQVLAALFSNYRQLMPTPDELVQLLCVSHAASYSKLPAADWAAVVALILGPFASQPRRMQQLVTHLWKICNDEATPDVLLIYLM